MRPREAPDVQRVDDVADVEMAGRCRRKPRDQRVRYALKAHTWSGRRRRCARSRMSLIVSRRNVVRILLQDHEVRELPGRDRSLDRSSCDACAPLIVPMRIASSTRDLLVRAPRAALVVRARDHALNRHERLERPGHVVRRTSDRDPGIEERAVREHPLHLLVAVLATTSRRGSRRTSRTASESSLSP